MTEERFSLTRSLIVGTLLCCLVPIMAHLSINIVHASSMTIDFLPVAAIFIFFVLVLLGNTCVRIIRRDAAMTRPELVVVYTMLLVCSSVTTMGLMAQLIPVMGAPTYFATLENRWVEMVHPHIPGWLMPDAQTIRGFFVGIKPDQPIPWAAWMLPMAGWMAFLLPAYFVMIAVMVVLRRQWVDREHLPFPLIALPAAMSESPREGRLLGPFFRNPGMWIGFTIVFLLTSSNALHSYWDVFPFFSFKTGLSLSQRAISIPFRLSFPVLGLTFLVSRDIAFSLWFFNLVFLWITGSFRVMGLRLDENLGGYDAGRKPMLAYFCLGGILVYVLAALHNAREHLRGVMLRAFGRPGGTDDSDEILSYRTAVWGSIVCLVVMWVWLSLVGLPPWIAPVYLVVVYLLFLGLTRIVSEGGLPALRLMMTAPIVIMSLFGTRLIGAAGLMTLALMYVWCVDTRIFPMAECAQGLKLVEACPARRRGGIFWGMVIALAVGIVLSMVITLNLAYRYGGLSLDSWYFVRGPQVPFRFMAEKLQSPSPPSLPGYGLAALGAGIMVILSVLRARFAWFTLHPIGFAVGPVMLMDKLWFSIFLAWLLKTLILRYGGATAYKKVVPFFLGLVLGQYSAAAFWFLVDLCTGKTGNVVFWI